jgi:uncharacterized Zn finger protein
MSATWWGRAWLEALEQRARLDPDRLPRGREYARDGAVGELMLTPGEARAQVQGRKTDPYVVRIRVRQFTDDEWDRVLSAISARLERAAALLDGELAPEVAQDTAAAGIDLLPGGGEIGPRCTCPDEADPCKHSAAACYLIADVLDADPFALFLLRGRTREQVMAGVRARRRADLGVSGPTASAPAKPGLAKADPAKPDPAQPDPAKPGPATPGPATPGPATPGPATPDADPGVDARSAFGAPVPAGPVPLPPLPPDRPGRPAALPVDPPPWRAGLREDLIELAADAARRAWELAVGLSPDASLALSPDVDLARRASWAIGTPAFGPIAARSGMAERDLARQALAWKHGGAAGLDLLTARWDPGAEDRDAPRLLDAARQALRAKTGEAAEVEQNRVSATRLQLRLGRDLLWYPYTRSGPDWEPSGAPAPNPSAAIADL